MLSAFFVMAGVVGALLLVLAVRSGMKMLGIPALLLIVGFIAYTADVPYPQFWLIGSAAAFVLQFILHGKGRLAPFGHALVVVGILASTAILSSGSNATADEEITPKPNPASSSDPTDPALHPDLPLAELEDPGPGRCFSDVLAPRRAEADGNSDAENDFKSPYSDEEVETLQSDIVQMIETGAVHESREGCLEDLGEWLEDNSEYTLVNELVEDFDPSELSDIAEYFEALELVELKSQLAIQNHYFSSEGVKYLRDEKLPEGELVFFVPGYQPGNDKNLHLRPVVKLVCGNPLKTIPDRTDENPTTSVPDNTSSSSTSVVVTTSSSTTSTSPPRTIVVCRPHGDGTFDTVTIKPDERRETDVDPRNGECPTTTSSTTTVPCSNPNKVCEDSTHENEEIPPAVQGEGAGGSPEGDGECHADTNNANYGTGEGCDSPEDTCPEGTTWNGSVCKSNTTTTSSTSTSTPASTTTAPPPTTTTTSPPTCPSGSTWNAATQKCETPNTGDPGGG